MELICEMPTKYFERLAVFLKKLSSTTDRIIPILASQMLEFGLSPQRPNLSQIDIRNVSRTSPEKS